MAFLVSGERVMLVTDSWDDNRVSASPQLNVMVSRGWIIAPAQHFTLQNIQAYILHLHLYHFRITTTCTS